MLIETFYDALTLLALLTALCLLNFLLLLRFFPQELLYGGKTAIPCLLYLFHPLLVVLLSLSLGLSLRDPFGLPLCVESLLHLLVLLLLALLQNLHICLHFDGGCIQHLVQPRPLLRLSNLAAQFALNFHRSCVSKSGRHHARLLILLMNEIIDGDLRKEVEADKYIIRCLR